MRRRAVLRRLAMTAVALSLATAAIPAIAQSGPAHGANAWWAGGVAYVKVRWHGHALVLPVRGLPPGTDLRTLHVTLSDPSGPSTQSAAPATGSASVGTSNAGAAAVDGGSATFPANAPRTPGTIVSIAGGHCDGYPALAATVSPSRVAVDSRGRLVWSDDDMAQPGVTLGLSALLSGTMTNSGSVLLRGVDGTGRVSTLGPLTTPVIGRAGRQAPATTPLTDVIPDGHGGVITNITGDAASPSLSGLWRGENDTPAQSSIVDIAANGGRRVLVQGKQPPDSPATVPQVVYAQSYPISAAPLGIIEAIARDSTGPNFFIASQLRLDGSGLNDANSPYAFGLPVDGNPQDLAHPAQPSVATVIQYANLGSAPVTFYPGKSWSVVVPPRSVRAIAGYSSTYAQTADAERTTGLGGNPTTTFIPEVPALQVRGSVLYLQSDFVDATVAETGQSGNTDDNIEIQAINLGRSDTTVNGTPVAAGNLARVVGDGTSPAGFAGDGGLARLAVFRVTGAGKRGSTPYATPPGDFVVDRAGDIFIADSGNNRIREVDPTGLVKTIAGVGVAGDPGDRLLPAVVLPLNAPFGLALDPAGRLVFADYYNRVVRRLNSDGTLTRVIGRGPTPCGDGQYATGRTFTSGAYFGQIANAASDQNGNTYVYDAAYRQIRRINRLGRVDLVIGRPVSCASWWHGAGLVFADPATHCPVDGPQRGDGGPASQAGFASIDGMVVDGHGNLYVTDVDRVRYINVGAKAVVVNGVRIGPGQIQTLIQFPARRVHVDASLALGVLPPLPVQPPKLPPPANDILTGILGLVGGTLHTSTTMDLPLGDVAVDGHGNLYIADPSLNYVYRLNYCGQLTTVAGNGAAPQSGLEGDGGAPTAAPVQPEGLLWDAATSTLLISNNGIGYADGAPRWHQPVRAVNFGSQTVREFGRDVRSGTIGTIAGAGAVSTLSGDGGMAYNANTIPTTMALGPGRRLYIAGSWLFGTVRVITADGHIGGLAGPWPGLIQSYGGGAIDYGTAGDGGGALHAWLDLADIFGQTNAAGYDINNDSVNGNGRAASLVKLGPDGNLLIGDAGGRLREIIDPRHAPLKLSSALPGIAGAGIGFTQTLPLYDDGAAVDGSPLASVDNRDGESLPELGAQPNGDVLAIGARGAGRGCALWRVKPSADGRLAADSLGDPDPGARGSGGGGSSCSVAANDVGVAAATPVRGIDTPDANDAGVAVSAAGPSGSWQSAIVADVPPENANRGPALLAAGPGQFVLARAQGSGIVVSTSTDGLVYNPLTASVVPSSAQTLGSLVLLRDGTPAIAFVAAQSGTRTIDVATRHGSSWQVSVVQAAHDSIAGAAPLSPPSLAVTSDGGLSLAWSDDQHVFLARSADGRVWSRPRALPVTGVSVLPSVGVGAHGQVVVAFYRSTDADARNASYPYASWYPTVVEVDPDGRHMRRPRLATLASVHFGPLCVTEQCTDTTLADELPPSGTPTLPTATTVPAPYGPGPVGLSRDSTGRTVAAFVMDGQADGNTSSVPVLGVARDCAGLRLGASAPGRCLAASPGSASLPDSGPVMAPPASSVSVPIGCSLPPTPYPPAQHAPATRPAPAPQPGRPVVRPPVQPAVIPPLVPEPPVEPALPPGQAPAPAQQLSQAQQQATQPQTGAQVGMATADEAEAQRARSFAYSRRSTGNLPPVTLAWLTVAGLSVVGFAARRRRRPVCAYVGSVRRR